MADQAKQSTQWHVSSALFYTVLCHKKRMSLSIWEQHFVFAHITHWARDAGWTHLVHSPKKLLVLRLHCRLLTAKLFTSSGSACCVSRLGIGHTHENVLVEGMFSKLWYLSHKTGPPWPTVRKCAPPHPPGSGSWHHHPSSCRIWPPGSSSRAPQGSSMADIPHGDSQGRAHIFNIPGRHSNPCAFLEASKAPRWIARGVWGGFLLPTECGPKPVAPFWASLWVGNGFLHWSQTNLRFIITSW